MRLRAFQVGVSPVVWRGFVPCAAGNNAVKLDDAVLGFLNFLLELGFLLDELRDLLLELEVLSLLRGKKVAQMQVEFLVLWWHHLLDLLVLL